MQQSAPAQPALSPSSFASLLAALTSPAKKAEPAWNDDGLEDDVATLSYERALRAHARYRTSDLTDRSLIEPANPDSEPIDSYETISVDPNIAHPEPRAALNPPLALDRNLKSASITIRLSNAECAQLRKRAAEAGLTISAYLRSCTFEAESLRALVKDTLAQLRTDPPKKKRPASTQRSWFAWLWRLLPTWNPNQRVARA